ncbi:MAG: hypothetical protein H7X88_00325 [Gloeobacteraceae cyanobacterium ES-bin-316]|nr:hypothetical protein [Ferruginibacter sp.]
MSLKEKIYRIYEQMLLEKIQLLQSTLQDLSQSVANETKSSAGDKHETALAMIQIEQENKRKQLKELQLQQVQFKKIDPTYVANQILNGALVCTDKGYFFISIALGKIVLEEKTIYALSPTSPLGQKLLGLRPGEEAAVNSASYRILSVE